VAPTGYPDRATIVDEFDTLERAPRKVASGAGTYQEMVPGYRYCNASDGKPLDNPA